MSDEKALLDAIWEHPHDDSVRLAYADWLQENGQPERAEFIRVQCELAALEGWDGSVRKVELEKREQQLWTRHAKEWKSHLPPNLRKTAGFRRGFLKPQPRTLTAAKFLALAADDVASAPLRDVRLSCNYRMLSKVLACPHLSRIGALDLRYWLATAGDVRAFVSSPFVRNVTDLTLTGSRFGDRGLAELAAGAAGLPHLRDLTVESCDLTVSGLETLLASPLTGGLRSLNLVGNAIGSEGVLALADCSRLMGLERLTIVRCEGARSDNPRAISGAAVAHLCASPNRTALKSLALDPVRFGPEEVRLMCETRPVFRLRALRLTPHFGVRDEGAEALAAWPGLVAVRELHLYGSQIGDRGAIALARSPYLNNVTELRLELNRFGTDAVLALIERFGADRVRVL